MLYCIILFCSVVFYSIASSNSACWIHIIRVMPTRRFLGMLFLLHISHPRDTTEPNGGTPLYKMYQNISCHVYSSWSCWHHEYCESKVMHIIRVMPTRSLSGTLFFFPFLVDQTQSSQTE